MITRYAKYAREKGRQKFISDGGFDIVDFDYSGPYPTIFTMHIEPFEKEANLMVGRITHELKDKHNMTKKKYRFLKSKLMKYLPYTSRSRRYPLSSLASDFDGDVLFRSNLLTPANLETSTSRQMMFRLIKHMSGKNSLFEPSKTIDPDFYSEGDRLKPFITRNQLDRDIAKLFIEAGQGRQAMILNKVGVDKVRPIQHMNDAESFTERYSCICGQDTGKDKEGKTCVLCNTQVGLMNIEEQNARMKEIYGNEHITLSNDDIKKIQEHTHPYLTIKDEYMFKEALSSRTKKKYGVVIKPGDLRK